MFNKILFPLDFSETSEQVLSYVLAMADKFDTHISVVYVTRDLSYFTELDVPYPTIYSFNQDIKRGAEKTMQRFCEQHLQGYKYSNYILSGDPATELVNFIKDNDIDLVIMGTHGRKGLDRIVFGSVAESVSRNSTAPVMTIRPKG